MAEQQQFEVWDVFRRQLRAARKTRNWSSRKLADRIADLGFDGPDASRIRQLETVQERAENVRLTEVIACAAGLGVAPVNLMTPFAENEWVLLGSGPCPPAAFRDWIRGRAPIGGDLDDWSLFYFG